MNRYRKDRYMNGNTLPYLRSQVPFQITKPLPGYAGTDTGRAEVVEILPGATIEAVERADGTGDVYVTIGDRRLRVSADWLAPHRIARVETASAA